MNEFLKLEEIFRPNPTQTTTCSHNWLFINRGITQDLCLWVLLYFLLNNEHFNICFFLRFRFPHFSSLITSPIFLFRTKSSYQNNESSDLSSIHWTRFFFKISRNVKCDWSISFIQVGRNRTHPIFQMPYYTNICTSSLCESAQSQTSCMIQVLSYKLFNVKPA